MTNELTGPQYIHDCTLCVFLGRYAFDGPLTSGQTIPFKSDLYVCEERGFGATLIVRVSSDGSDYSSHLVSLIERDEHHWRSAPSTRGPALLEAFDRYKAFELLRQATAALLSHTKGDQVKTTGPTRHVEVFVLSDSSGWGTELVEIPEEVASSESQDRFLEWVYSEAGEVFRAEWGRSVFAVFVCSWVVDGDDPRLDQGSEEA